MTKKSSKSLYMMTLGCPKNRVDSEVMLGTLQQRGYHLVQEAAEAEVIVVNTCAFLAAAEKESVDNILELAEHKKTGRCSTLVVTGCLVQRHGETLLAELPEVDHFLGTGAYVQLGDVLAAEASPRLIIPDPDTIATAAVPRTNSMPGYTAYLKIAEGCDNTCAFCIIPTLRGAQRSRTVADLVEEATRLAESGVKELNLVAQDLTAYGHDLPGKPSLASLLRALCQVDVRWIRLHYAYPRVFSDELIEVMATEPKIARYLDMPLQHASDRLLRSMRRGRDSAFLKTLVAKLRARVPGLTFRTSLIVGLPGETEEDFELLQAFVKELRFERLGVFQYSDEPGTAAFEMEGKVPKKVIERRWRQVMAIQKRISREQNRALVGTRLQVLVEGVSPETELLLVGRHQGQAPEIDGMVYLNEGLAYPGELVTVEVTEAHDYDVVGKIVAREAGAPALKGRLAPPAQVRGGEKLVSPPTWLAPR